MSKNLVKKDPYDYIRAMILDDVVAKMSEDKVDGKSTFRFDFNDCWDGNSNQYVTDTEIKRWKEFLLVDDDIYREYFDLDALQRQALWRQIETERNSDQFGDELYQKVSDGAFKNHTKQGQRLLLLRRLSRAYLEDMILNGAAEDEDWLGQSMSLEQKFGPDGLYFDGQPNQYLNQATIEKEWRWLDVTDDEFKRFYQLNPYARMLLIESMLFF